MSERITETIGIYTVHALRIGKHFKARALAGDRRVADGEGDTAAAAIAAVRGKLDQFRPPAAATCRSPASTATRWRCSGAR
ncbi:MAG: hypothetical protein U1E14_20715 [Geminicoccaceae bacterium]